MTRALALSISVWLLACGGDDRPDGALDATLDAAADSGAGDGTAGDATMDGSTPDADAAMPDSAVPPDTADGRGSPCTDASECAADQSCVDGVCCASVCDGVCERCDVAGWEGTCTAAAASTDPDDECTGFACAGYYVGFEGGSDACSLRADVDDATATCNGARACASQSELCPTQPASTVQIDCDDDCQAPTTGTCRGTNPGTCDDLDDTTDTLSCGVGGCGRTVQRCRGGAPATCTPGTPETEICGNSVDEDCDGTLGGPGPIYRVPITVTNTSASALDDGAIRFTITDRSIAGRISSRPLGVQVYTSPTATFSTPYRGLPFFIEDVDTFRAIIWVRLTIAAGASRTLYLITNGPGPDGADPGAVFDYFDDFDGASPLSDWTYTSNFAGDLGSNHYVQPRPRHSAPQALRDLILADHCESGGRYAYSIRGISLPSSGLYRLALYGAAATCSTCTQDFIGALDTDVVIQAAGTGVGTGSMRYAEGTSMMPSGTHQLTVGVFVGTGICSGVFEAFTDDIMIAKTVDPAPSVTVDATMEVNLGCL